MTNFELISQIINNNGGYITRRDVDLANISSAFLYQYVKKYKLVKYCSGFYAKKEWVYDEYFVFQYQYPKLIYSFYTSAFLNRLGDYMPPYLEVTAPKNYRPFPLPRAGLVLHTDTRDYSYKLGITEVETVYGNKVKVYGIDKTICDFIRNREKIDSESFVKCLNWYKNRKDKDINALMEYARTMKIEEKVNSLMEVILNED